MEGGGAAGGPAPFLLKTYEMVDDSSTDSIVSWSANNTSFVVWNPPDFATRLLPAYFKHNNFSSFIRQLNTYGFRKIDPERWEFSNEDFAKGKKHLLKNIHRRKPIHSHSHPPGSIPDPERSSIEEELDQLSREKTALEADLWRFKQQQSGTKVQLEDLEVRLFGMEGRQLKMLAFLQRAVQNPKFVDNLISMAGAGSEDFTVATTIHKKRRLPGSDYSQEAADDSSFDDHTNITAKPDTGQVFNRDFSDKLKLELCPAISDTNLVSSSTHGSNEEDVRSLQWKQPDRVDCVSLVVPEQLELSDTGNSFCPRKNVLLPRLAYEGEGLAACHLSLTLASSSMQVDISHNLEKSPNSGDQGWGATSEVRTLNTGRENELSRKNSELNERITNESGAANAQPLQGPAPSDKQVPAPPPAGRVNDVFWEQFLTERPGSSDVEEASSSVRANPYDEQPELKKRSELKKQSDDSIWKNKKDTEQLSP